MSAIISGVEENLIIRCSTIFQAISSGYNINSAKFGEYALETAKLLIIKFVWYHLPASVHKVLLHGRAIIKKCLVSIGELSEEAAEAKNKDVKLFRLNHTRKMSRVLTNTDLLNRLLLSSDPFIACQRKLQCKPKSKLLKSAIDLLDETM